MITSFVGTVIWYQNSYITDSVRLYGFTVQSIEAVEYTDWISAEG